MNKITLEMIDKFMKHKDLQMVIKTLKDPKAMKKFVADHAKRVKACLDAVKK
jgi:hypothetical protein